MDFKKRLLFIIFLLSFLGKINAVNDTQAKVVLDKTGFFAIKGRNFMPILHKLSFGMMERRSGLI